jgi:predicted secreted hydrolase
VEPDGSYQTLSADRFLLVPRQWWQPVADALAGREAAALCPGAEPGYPVSWDLTLDGDHFQLQAAIDDQRMATSVPYWEGLIYIFRDGERVGRGFLEMTGYR